MFFYLSKIFWFVANPLSLLILLLLLSLAFLQFGHSKWRKAKWSLLVSVCIVSGTLLVLPIGDWILYPWEQHRPRSYPEKVDGIIILGGSIDPVMSAEHHEVMIRDAAQRLTSIIQLHRKYPKAKIIFTGGSGDIRHPDTKEADYAKILFDEWGVTPVTYERQSRNTFENAVFSKKIIRPKPSESWLLVTSAYHMPRARKIFEKQHWPVTPYPVDYKATKSPPVICFCIGTTMNKLDIIFHEWLGIFAYRLTGKI